MVNVGKIQNSWQQCVEEVSRQYCHSRDYCFNCQQSHPCCECETPTSFDWSESWIIVPSLLAGLIDLFHFFYEISTEVLYIQSKTFMCPLHYSFHIVKIEWILSGTIGHRAIHCGECFGLLHNCALDISHICLVKVLELLQHQIWKNVIPTRFYGDVHFELLSIQLSTRHSR
jgi:hypothetical protein